MNINYLEIQGFRSIKKAQRFDFSDISNGFYFISGENKVNPELGSNGCLIGDTLIDTPRDLSKYPLGIPIKDLVGQEIQVYSYDSKEKRICLKTAFNIRKTGIKKPVYKVEYSSDIYGIKNVFNDIILTADHLVMKRDGTYCKAIELKCSDSLMPFYRTKPDGYAKINLNNGDRVYEHKFILSELGKASEHGHHRDKNKVNNSVDNLEPMFRKEHLRLHSNDKGQLDKMIQIAKTNHPKGMLGKEHTEESKNKIGLNSPFNTNDFRIKHKRIMNSPEVIKKLSKLKKRKVAKQDLINLYIDKKYTIEKVSEKLDVCPLTVSSSLQYYEIPKRDYSEAQLNRKGVRTPSKSDLGFLYLEKRLSMKSIASRLGVSATMVGNWLVRYNIPKRTKKEIQELQMNHKVISVDFYGYEDVYDMEVPKTHNFVANGIIVHNSGKSTFFSDSLLWVLTGKTSLGLKAGNVKSWGSKDKCEGKIGFVIDGEDYEVKRTWKPNSLILNGEEVSQERLDDLIGHNHSTILHSIVISQFAAKFFDLDPAPKLEVFSEILGDVDVWLCYSDKSKEEAGKVSDLITTVEASVNKLEGNLETLKEQDFSEKSKEWEEKNREEIEKSAIYFKNAEKDIRRAKKDLKECVEGLELDIEKEVKAIQHEKGAQSRFDITDRTCGVLEKRIDGLKIKIELKEDEKKKFESVKDTCPHCDQKVSRKYLRDKGIELEKISNEYYTNIKEEQSALEIHNISRDLGFEEVKEAEKDLRKIRTRISEAQFLEDRILDDIEGWEEDLQIYKSAMKDLEDKKNPFETLMVENADKIDGIEKELKTKLFERTTLQKKEADYTYWVKAFKDIRLLVIDEALAEFEIYLNNSLQGLGLGDWDITVSVDKETKSKTIKKGFFVKVKAPDQKEAVPFEAYCGGERGILRLSATIGLIEFIKSRKNATCNLEIWDEPTCHLSPSVTESMLTLLQQRCKDKKVLLIDHHNLEASGHFTGKIHVTKEEEGTMVELCR